MTKMFFPRKTFNSKSHFSRISIQPDQVQSSCSDFLTTSGSTRKEASARTLSITFHTGLKLRLNAVQENKYDVWMYNCTSSCKFLVDEKSSEIFAQTVLVCCALCCFLKIYIGVHTCADLDIYSAPSLKGRSVQLIGGIEFVLHQKGSQQYKILFPVFLHYDNSTAHHI